MCTRLLKSAGIHHRWIMSKIFDREHPYQVILKLVRQTPKQESDVDFIFIPGKGIAPAFTSKVSYVKESRYRYKTEHEASNVVKMLNDGSFCIKCGDPSNCTKRMFKIWSKE